MPLKIVFDANPLVINKSGVGYYTHSLIQALADNYPHDIELVGYYFNFAGRRRISGLPDAPNIRYQEVRLIPGKVLNICRRLRFQFPLWIFLKQPCDIVLSTNFVPSLRLRKSKQVVVVYDLGFIDHPEYVSDRNGMFLRRWVPKALKKSAIVIAISDFTKQRIMKTYKVPEKNICITPIPPAPHVAVDYSILENHRLRDGYLLFVGTIEPRKNIIGLVQAYALLPEKIRDKYSLVLAGGKGWHDEEMLACIAELQSKGLHIIVTGYISDGEKAALYEKATACVQPSHYEGFGMPILEAMSYGLPIACSDIPVFHEVAGNAALFFDKDRSRAIADTLSLLLTNREKQSELHKQSLQHVAVFPTWEKVADKLYARLIELSSK